MAKKRKTEGNGENVSGYWRQVFTANPGWVRKRSNAKAFAQWLADHPGSSEVPESAKAVLSNIKSGLRLKKGRRGRKPVAAATSNGVVVRVAKVPMAVLEKLEEKIDECLTVARGLGADALEPVIDHLRRARNTVVLKQGT